MQAFLAVTVQPGNRFEVVSNNAKNTLYMEPAKDHNVGVTSDNGKRYCTSSIPATLKTQLMGIQEGEQSRRLYK